VTRGPLFFQRRPLPSKMAIVNLQREFFQLICSDLEKRCSDRLHGRSGC
jgi:hypothetical protein